MLLLDCGSSSSRLYSCAPGCLPGGTALHQLPPLHQVIATGQTKQFIRQLQDAVNQTAPTANPFFVGATGGMRDALHTGAVTHSALDDFVGTLLDTFPQASYQTLDGTVEASLEYQAVRFAAEATGLVPPDKDSQLTIVSMGGASIQLSTSKRYLSLRAGMKQTTATCWNEADNYYYKGTAEFIQLLRKGPPAVAVQQWEEAVSTAIADGLAATKLRAASDKQQQHKTVVGISTTYFAAVDCGISGAAVQQQRALEAVSSRIVQLLDDPVFIEELSLEVSGKKSSTVSIDRLSRAVVLRCIVSTMFASCDSFVFRRQWQLPGIDEAFTTNYASGKMLDLLMAERDGDHGHIERNDNGCDRVDA